MGIDSSSDSRRALLHPKRLALIVLGLLALGGLFAVYRGRARGPADQPREGPRRTGPQDPRLTFATPFRNVRPEVKYMGDGACAVCHADKEETFRQHPMGRSLAPVSAAAPLEDYGPAAHNPFETSGFRYLVKRRGNLVFHQETALDRQGKEVSETTAEVQFAVGSGQRGRAYLINREGYLFASPLTWYPAEGLWDLSPGYERRNPHFGRPVTPDCLFCHSNYADHLENTINRYREPIFRGHALGCERCHGPGELHIKEREGGQPVPGEVDYSIVNPKHLAPDLRESVCQQCHLQGQQRVARRGLSEFDYRPGLPWHLFVSDFVRLAEDREGKKFVGTVEQLVSSRCFRESQGQDQLGCTSCHDPHQRPAAGEVAAYYRQRCLACHQDRGCSLPVARRLEKQDHCITCHMPRTGSTFNHTSITDHRIPRQPDAASRPAVLPDWPRPGERPLIHFHRNLTASDDGELARGLGIALVRVADGLAGPQARQLAESAFPLLRAAVALDPDDVPALDATGDSLLFQGRLEETLEVYEAALKRSPDREVTLVRVADLAMRLNRGELSRSYWERALRVNPWRWQYHLGLARTLAQLKNWSACARECRRALQLQATHLATRQLLITCLVRLGERDQARTELDILVGLSSAEQEDGLKHWFRQMVP
jgi:predicted CXXCH cytochrome family protein